MAAMDNGDVLTLRAMDRVFILNIKKSSDQKLPNDVTEVYLKPGFKFNNVPDLVNPHKIPTLTGNFKYIKGMVTDSVFCHCDECRKGIVESALRNEDMSYLGDWEKNLQVV